MNDLFFLLSAQGTFINEKHVFGFSWRWADK